MYIVQLYICSHLHFFCNILKLISFVCLICDRSLSAPFVDRPWSIRRYYIKTFRANTDKNNHSCNLSVWVLSRSFAILECCLCLEWILGHGLNRLKELKIRFLIWGWVRRIFFRSAKIWTPPDPSRHFRESLVV